MQERDAALEATNLPEWAYQNKDGRASVQPEALGEAILKEINAIYVDMNDDLTLWKYDTQLGMWVPLSRQEIKFTITAKLKSVKAWKAKLAHETEKYVLDSIPVRSVSDTIDAVRPWLAHFTNGAYNFETGKLEKNKPSNNFFSGREYDLDTKGKTPLTDKWLSESFGGAKQFMLEFIGYSFYRTYQPFQKFTILKGEGANGKSTFLNWFKLVIGENNASNVSLQALTDPSNRFDMANLYQKSANFYADISDGLLIDVSRLKAITGNDSIALERKSRQGFNAKLFAKLTFATNSLPAVKDSSHGFNRRPCVVQFTKIPDFPKRFNMKDIYKEIPAFTFKCLEAFRIALANGQLSETPKMIADRDEWLKMNNVVEMFIDETCIRTEGQFVKKTTLYDSYKDYCFNNGYHPVSNQKFKRELERLGIFEDRPYIDGSRTRVFMGIEREAQANEKHGKVINYPK